MFQPLAYPPVLIGPYSRKRRTKMAVGASQLAMLALVSITVGSVLAFVL